MRLILCLLLYSLLPLFLAVKPQLQGTYVKTVSGHQATICIQDHKAYCENRKDSFKFSDGCRRCRCYSGRAFCKTQRCVIPIPTSSTIEAYCQDVLNKNEVNNELLTLKKNKDSPQPTDSPSITNDTNTPVPSPINGSDATTTVVGNATTQDKNSQEERIITASAPLPLAASLIKKSNPYLKLAKASASTGHDGDGDDIESEKDRLMSYAELSSLFEHKFVSGNDDDGKDKSDEDDVDSDKEKEKKSTAESTLLLMGRRPPPHHRRRDDDDDEKEERRHRQHREKPDEFEDRPVQVNALDSLLGLLSLTGWEADGPVKIVDQGEGVSQAIDRNVRRADERHKEALEKFARKIDSLKDKKHGEEKKERWEDDDYDHGKEQDWNKKKGKKSHDRQHDKYHRSPPPSWMSERSKHDREDKDKWTDKHEPFSPYDLSRDGQRFLHDTYPTPFKGLSAKDMFEHLGQIIDFDHKKKPKEETLGAEKFDDFLSHGGGGGGEKGKSMCGDKSFRKLQDKYDDLHKAFSMLMEKTHALMDKMEGLKFSVKDKKAMYIRCERELSLVRKHVNPMKMLYAFNNGTPAIKTSLVGTIISLLFTAVYCLIGV